MAAQTVTGPIDAAQLGFTLPHEHVIFGYPGYQGDVTLGPFDHGAALDTCVQTARAVLSRGIKTLVDATPNECGRDPAFLREVSQASGLQILCSTGYYYEGEGAKTYFEFRASLGGGEGEIHEMMLKEVTEGIGKTGIRAGVIKLASSRDAITPYEQMFFRAAARLEVITTLLNEGYADRMLLSHDSIWHWLGRPIPLPEAILPAIQDWHPLHLSDDILPELQRRGITSAQIEQMTVKNPARIFG